MNSSFAQFERDEMTIHIRKATNKQKILFPAIFPLLQKYGCIVFKKYVVRLEKYDKAYHILQCR